MFFSRSCKQNFGPLLLLCNPNKFNWIIVVVFLFSIIVRVWFGMVNMLEELPQRQELTSLFRRSLSRRRSIRSGGGVDRDDRGWTLLHIGARKGDLKEVSFSFFLSLFFILGQEFVLINWLILVSPSCCVLISQELSVECRVCVFNYTFISGVELTILCTFFLCS